MLVALDGACVPGLTHCGGERCANLATDTFNCGGCGRRCVGVEACAGGRCVGEGSACGEGGYPCCTGDGGAPCVTPLVCMLGPGSVLTTGAFLSCVHTMRYLARSDVRVVSLDPTDGPDAAGRGGGWHRSDRMAEQLRRFDAGFAGHGVQELSDFYLGLAITLATQLSRVQVCSTVPGGGGGRRGEGRVDVCRNFCSCC